MQTTGDPWGMLEYEVKMFDATYKIFFTRSTFTVLPQALKNAVEESAVLHTRNLCEIFLGLSKKRDAIRLADLLQGWPRHPRHTKITAMNKKLRRRYPRQLFNQHVMHPTRHRGTEYNYEKDLADLHPLIQDIIAELDDEFDSLTGKGFNLQFVGPTYQRAVFWPDTTLLPVAACIVKSGAECHCGKSLQQFCCQLGRQTYFQAREPLL